MTEALDRWAARWLWLARAVIIASILIIATYAADRETPFRMLSVEPAQVTRGSTAVLRANVWRDLTRHCSAEFARYIFDSAGTRFDLGNSLATDDMIRGMDRATPGRLVTAIEVPERAAPGPAKLVTALQYRCNKVHAIWPIETTTELPFTVLP